MKDLLKIFFASLLLSLIVLLSSCGESGGTIIVTNTYSSDVEVAVHSDFKSYGIVFSYEDKYGPKNITAGGTGTFNVKSNTNFSIIVRHPSSSSGTILPAV